MGQDRYAPKCLYLLDPINRITCREGGIRRLSSPKVIEIEVQGRGVRSLSVYVRLKPRVSRIFLPAQDGLEEGGSARYLAFRYPFHILKVKYKTEFSKPFKPLKALFYLFLVYIIQPFQKLRFFVIHIISQEVQVKFLEYRVYLYTRDKFNPEFFGKLESFVYTRHRIMVSKGNGLKPDFFSHLEYLPRCVLAVGTCYSMDVKVDHWLDRLHEKETGVQRI